MHACMDACMHAVESIGAWSTRYRAMQHAHLGTRRRCCPSPPPGTLALPCVPAMHTPVLGFWVQGLGRCSAPPRPAHLGGPWFKASMATRKGTLLLMARALCHVKRSMFLCVLCCAVPIQLQLRVCNIHCCCSTGTRYTIHDTSSTGTTQSESPCTTKTRIPLTCSATLLVSCHSHAFQYHTNGTDARTHGCLHTHVDTRRHT
jgi:hypothetical protein